jgi:hypothetical protein
MDIIYLTLYMISNDKVINCEDVDLVKYYNFNFDFVFI